MNIKSLIFTGFFDNLDNFSFHHQNINCYYPEYLNEENSYSFG